ncbi:putative Ferric uptake regulation protein [Nitrospira japonica]|uniref:Putative Ferric uptake regulation protein n=1 Tax=Nitrospira japonica TaxID=1325564 RepID=A0A1W1I4Y6_9BACT|nr:putative Ferric uptake regulation protein [Nitrospira japonica]
MNTSSLTHRLKASGKKLTQARQAILTILEGSQLPITAAEVHARLMKAHMPADRVTVYRNLSLLEKLRLVNTVGFHDGQMRYEIHSGREHHHHIQCLTCGKIADLMLCPLEKLTQLVEKQTRFSVDRHALEFFGWCPQCR